MTKAQLETECSELLRQTKVLSLRIETQAKEIEQLKDKLAEPFDERLSNIELLVESFVGDIYKLHKQFCEKLKAETFSR